MAAAGAEREKDEEERLSDAARQAERQQADWEDDGGALDLTESPPRGTTVVDGAR